MPSQCHRDDLIEEVGATEPLVRAGRSRPRAPATVAAGTNPRGVAVSPDGASVYVANQGSGSVSQYDVGAGGLLAPKIPATVGAGTGPFAVAVSLGPAPYPVPASAKEVKGSLVQVFRQCGTGANPVNAGHAPPLERWLV